MIHLIFTDSERLALAGSLAGYRCLTREAYALDLRQFTTWCRGRSLPLFAVRRAEIESFARTRTAVLAWVGAERDGAQRDPEVSFWVLGRFPGAVSGSGLPPCWGGARAAVKTMASGDLWVPRLDGMTVRWTGGARF